VEYELTATTVSYPGYKVRLDGDNVAFLWKCPECGSLSQDYFKADIARERWVSVCSDCDTKLHHKDLLN
jgi:hypothetical protein